MPKKRSRPGPELPSPGPQLIQTRVPPNLYKRIKACAEAELLTVAAYVRRTLQNHVPGG